MKQKYVHWSMVAALLCGTIQAQADVPLKIARGEQDTVYRAKHYIVGVTKAGSKATVNGQDSKVYKTGAFGAELMLQEGNNPIEIMVSDGKESTVKTLNVFYQPRPATPRMLTQEEAERSLKRNTLKETLYYAESKEGAHMQYGDGDDRLGGSKMGFVDAGIVFKVVGEKGSLAKVQLSEHRYAYMPKSDLRPTEQETRCVNTGSWSVSNAGSYDRVSVSLPQRLPYYSWTQLDPTTICVELYGAMNNSNWMTQRGELKMVDYVDFRQVESDVYQMIIKLQKTYSWGYSVGYEGNTLVVKVKHTPSLALKDLTIGLDAGHGGKSSGAVSVTGITEKEVNLQLINEVKALLEAKGAKVVLSREADYDISMTDRKKIFREKNVDLMISIHNNAGGSPLAEMGTSTYYKHISNRALAACMLNRLLELGLKNYGLTGNFNFSLNGPTEYPNVLLEVLFMSSLPEEEKLADADFRKKVARQAVLGLEDYLKKVREAEAN